MASKDTKAAFDAAAKALKQADTKAQDAGRRADDLAAQLLQAKLESARLDTEVERFAIGDESGDEIRKKAAGLARELGGKRAECETVIALLDRALTAAQEAQRNAKVEAARCEARALELQQQHAKELGAELVREFFAENRTKLLRILQVVHMECVLQRFKKYRDYPDGFTGICTLEDLFSCVLAEAAAEVEKADTGYESVLGTTTKADVPNTPLLASAITKPERGRISALAWKHPTDAELLDAVSRDDTPPAPQPMGKAEFSNCIDQERAAADRLRSAQSSVAYCEQELAKAQDADEKRDAAERLERYRKQAQEAGEAQQRWRAMIEADQALR